MPPASYTGLCLCCFQQVLVAAQSCQILIQLVRFVMYRSTLEASGFSFKPAEMRCKGLDMEM